MPSADMSARERRNRPRSKFATFAGLIVSTLGLVLLFKDSIYSPRHRLTIEFGEYHWVVGLILIAGGMAIIFARTKGGESDDE